MCEPWWFAEKQDAWGFVRSPKGHIQVEACERGFLIVWDSDTLAFTDRVDAADWLLGWLGFDDEIVKSVLDILWDAGELVDRDELWPDLKQLDMMLDIVKAAQAYVEAPLFPGVHDKLRETVKKWRDADELYRTNGGPCTWEQPEGIDTCTEAIEVLVEMDYQNRLDVLEAAQAFIQPDGDGAYGYNRLVTAVRKWRGDRRGRR